MSKIMIGPTGSKADQAYAEFHDRVFKNNSIKNNITVIDIKKRMKIFPKICLGCNKEFKPKLNEIKFCSGKCYQKFRQLKYKNCKTKLCPNCKIEKSSSEFFRAKSTGHLYSWCKKCCNTRSKEVYHFKCVDCGKPFQRIKRNTSEIEASKTNRCGSCSKIKIIKDNGGVPVNYSGTNNFTGTTFSDWVSSAKRRKKLWSLSKDDLENLFKQQNGVCALSGINMIPKKNTPYIPSIDRIDSSKGYVLGNVQFVCSMVNMMKNRFKQNEFIKMCKLIASHCDALYPSES